MLMCLTDPMGIGYFPMPCCSNSHGFETKKKVGMAPFMANLMEDMAMALKLSM